MLAKETIGATNERNVQSSERKRSTVGFPYMALDDAIAVAKGVHVNGGNTCRAEQLAPHLGHPQDSSMFRGKVNAARIFGLTTNSHGYVTLTPLGVRICETTQEAAAKTEAFMTVPLYKQIYEHFKGTQLPPMGALETAIENMGVSPKQKSTARQVFVRSATQAGFFAYGPSRLIYPSVKAGVAQDTAHSSAPISQPEIPKTKDSTQSSKNSTGGGDDRTAGGGRFHPLIEGLIATLPAPDSDWPIGRRAKWLRAASHDFDLIYKDPEDGSSIEIKIQKGAD